MSALPEHKGKGRELSLSIAGLRAAAIQTDEGIIVLKGSQAAKDTGALQTGYKAIRNTLISNDVLKFSGNKYAFQDNTRRRLSVFCDPAGINPVPPKALPVKGFILFLVYRLPV